MAPSVSPLPLEAGVSLRTLNTFGLPAVAAHLVRVRNEADLRRLLDDRVWGLAPKFILGGGSNVVFTRDVLLAKLTKRGVDIRFLDLSAKIEKIGGDKVR
ncbi:MAG: hypothetical protein ACKOD9_22105, partial [Rubrivivax sp.]